LHGLTRDRRGRAERLTRESHTPPGLHLGELYAICATEVGRLQQSSGAAYWVLCIMVAGFLKRLIQKNRAFILARVLEVKGLMQLLMKNRNTGEKWTPEELIQIRGHLKGIARLVPVILVFLLPGGALLLPLLAEVLDRRKQIRSTSANPRGPSS